MFRTRYSGANTPFVSLYEEHQHFHQNPEKNHHLFCFPPARSSVDIQFFCMSDSDYPRAFFSFPRMAGCVSEIGSSPGILAIMNQGDIDSRFMVARLPGQARIHKLIIEKVYHVYMKYTERSFID
jgi:hypothetical protein